MSIHREKVYACIHPETYKYYMSRDQVREIWDLLAERYGPVKAQPALGIIEIRTKRLLIRALKSGNPITLIRKRRCTEQDIADFHTLVGFDVIQRAA